MGDWFWYSFAAAVVGALTSISLSLHKIAKALAEQTTKEEKGEVIIMFLLDATHDPVNFGISIADIKDKEGNEVPRSEVTALVKISDATVLGVEFDQASDQGVISFGAPGESSFTIDVVDKDDPSQLLATNSWAFKLIAGDPDSVGSVSAVFEGIEEQPTEPPVDSGAEG